jgi:5'-deoxynucleotidase YfbR-like HD superfamily hydrolase
MISRKNRIQVKAVREAGLTRRAHVLPYQGSYNIAQHSYGATSLLLLLNPDPSLELIKAVMWHDVAERWLGDLPSPAKVFSKELKEIYEAEELKILKTLELFPGLSLMDQRWLKAVDIMDLWLWARENRAQGDLAVTGIMDNCYLALVELRRLNDLPDHAKEFFDMVRSETSEVRLSDYFNEVAEAGFSKAK